MKKIIVALIILIIWASPLSAEIYNSPFGFSIDIPSHWLIISKDKIKDNPDLVDFDQEEFKNFNKDILNHIKNLVTSGNTEIYLNTKTSNYFFNDNINIIKTFERVPQTVSELNQFCAKIPQDLSEAYGKPIKAYKCEFKKVAGFNGVYLSADGVLDGTKSIAYQLQKSPNVAMTITATCRNDTFEIIRKEFDEIMASFTFTDTKITNNSKLHETIEQQEEESKRYESLESEREVTSPELPEKKKVREFNYDDGSQYIGDIVNGKRHGQGTYIWADGRKYVGAFENNRATGGWLVKTADKRGWIYQDTEGKWINEVDY